LFQKISIYRFERGAEVNPEEQMIIQVKDRTFPNEPGTYECDKCGEKFRNQCTSSYHKCPEEEYE